MKRYLRTVPLPWAGTILILSLLIGCGRSLSSNSVDSSEVAINALPGFAKTTRPEQDCIPELRTLRNSTGATPMMLNRTLEIAGSETDILFLYHPDNFSHRRHDPPGWWYYDFAIGRELAEGNLVRVVTGPDNWVTIRLTTEGLTAEERQHVVGSQTFRLRVRHGQIYVTDGYDDLPNGGIRLPGGQCVLPPQTLDYEQEMGIELPNGNYRVTVSTFDWGTQSDDDQPAYTFEFQAIENLEDVDPPNPFTVLFPGEEEWTDESLPYTRKLGEVTEESRRFVQFERGVMPVLQWSGVIFPDIPVELSLTHQQYEALHDAALSQQGFDGAIAVSVDPNSQTIATLLQVSGIRSRVNVNTGQPTYDVGGQGRTFIRLRRTFNDRGIQWAEVERYTFPAAAASDEQVELLKSLFSNYVERNVDYPQRVAYPNFYAEQVASIQNPRLLSWYVANALELPLSVQQELLVLSDRDRIEKLIDILSVAEQ